MFRIKLTGQGTGGVTFRVEVKKRDAPKDIRLKTTVTDNIVNIKEEEKANDVGFHLKVKKKETPENISLKSNTVEVQVPVKGEKGDDGLSAYEVWLSLGNTGTEEDFIASLKGEPGAAGDSTVNGFEIGVGLKMEDNILSVDSATDFDGDNTRPVEAAFMQEQIGNIELLLKTI